jgi:hypothetical protein
MSAQTIYTSHYSRFGIGKINNKSYADNIGLGYSGIAYTNKFSTNPLNLASLTSMDSMSFIFNVGLKGAYNLIETNDISEEHYFANISYFSIAFPVTKWWFTGLGLRPFSTMGYQIQNTSDVLDNNNDVITQTTQTYTGEGDINQIYLSQAFKYKNLSFGVNASYLYGSLDKTTTLAFPTDAGAYNMYSKSRTMVNDFYFDFGLQYQKKLSKNTKMFIGLTYDIKKNIMSQSTLYLDRYFGNSSDTITDGTINYDGITLPSSIGIGVGFEFNEKVLLLSDFKITNWKEAKIYDNDDKLANSTSINVGLQYIPSDRSLKYTNKINYRMGGYYKKSYIVINDEQLKNFGITFGFGFPLRKTGTMFNFGFDLGQYGTTDNGLIKESYIGGHLSLSLFDKWFYKRKFD